MGRVVDLARRRGARVNIVDEGEWQRASRNRQRHRGDGWHESPFSHVDLAIDSIERAVYVHEKALSDMEVVGQLIHELGHLHALGGNVENSDEWAWLGWEFAVAREIRCLRVWEEGMYDYVMGDVVGAGRSLLIDGNSWGNLDTVEKSYVKLNREGAARSSRLIDAKGKAIWRYLPKPY